MTSGKTLHLVRYGQNPQFTLSFNIALRNFGTGPADIANYFAKACVFDAPPSSGKQPHPVYSDGETNRVNDSLIAPNEIVPDRFAAVVSFDNRERNAISNETRRIGIHGRFRYRGASENFYETRFFWWYFPLESRFIRALPPELNAHT